MAVVEEPQTRLDEKVIEQSALEEALEERERRNNSRKELQRQFKEADDRARALLSEFDLQDGEVARCGRFRISKRAVPSRAVSFETSPSSQIKIQLAVPDED